MISEPRHRLEKGKVKAGKLLVGLVMRYTHQLRPEKIPVVRPKPGLGQRVHPPNTQTQEAVPYSGLTQEGSTEPLQSKAPCCLPPPVGPAFLGGRRAATGWVVSKTAQAKFKY